LSEEIRPAEWTESDRVLIDHLERRRSELAVAGWQAPALTMAAQAFLLIVLTDATIPTYARAFILLAGVIATIAAITSMLRLRAREQQYSEAIASHTKRLGIPDLRPFHLPAEKSLPWLLRAATSERWPKIHHWWPAALFLFVLADFVAFFATIGDGSSPWWCMCQRH
jgi:hypothetical protein